MIPTVSKYKLNSKCFFIAPTIFSDSQMQIDWLKADKGIHIKPYKIVDFIEYLEKSKSLV